MSAWHGPMPRVSAAVAAGLPPTAREGSRRVATRPRRPWVVAGLLALISVAPPSRAAEPDHDEALRLRQAGQILPLQEVVARVVSQSPGRILEVELERAGDDYVYEVEILEPGGTLRRLWLDARTAQPTEPPGGDHR